MGPWVREADDEEEDQEGGGRLRRVAGKRGVLVRQQRSLESTLVGELARGAIVELATDAVEGAARVRISAPLEGWVTARLLEPLSAEEPEPLIAPLSPPTEESGPQLDNGKVTDTYIKQSLEHLKQQKLLKREVVVSILTQAKDLLEKEATVVDLDTPSDAPHVTVCGDVHGQFYDLLTIF